jgi:hypothetical protein
VLLGTACALFLDLRLGWFLSNLVTSFVCVLCVTYLAVLPILDIRLKRRYVMYAAGILVQGNSDSLTCTLSCSWFLHGASHEQTAEAAKADGSGHLKPSSDETVCAAGLLCPFRSMARGVWVGAAVM